VTLPVSRKAQREQAKETQRAGKAAKATSPSGSPLLKRKRSDVDESDPKLKEFLEVMRPKSKSKTWDTEDTQAQDVQKPPRKVQAMELPEAESDNEYEMVPIKSKKKKPTPVTSAPPVAGVPFAVVEPFETGEAEIQGDPPQASGGLDATDDDWLRSRTNRLLDLVDPADMAAKMVPEDGLQQPPQLERPLASAKVDTLAEQEDIGRLFARNLPYTATEDDLRKHFESYGTLEEVSTFH
jgi:multiple RNA-binding domain-containing protein 1